MKIHHCPVEGASITFEGMCNWCGEKEWVNLTGEEIMECLEVVYKTNVDYDGFARAIEAMLKEKNHG